MPSLRLDNVSKVFASGRSRIVALDQLSLSAHEGELLVILGPSGCGKTTLLRIIAGLETPNSGEITLGSESITRHKPQDRRIGMAFQFPALLPQLTVAENIALGPRLRDVPATERSNRTRELAELLNITDLLPRLPDTLSGGQQQRVSLARALATRPDLLLLDEPLANLDPTSRSQLRESIRAVQQKLRVTTLYVTHDQAEAAALADRIAIVHSGRLQQIATAPELYTNPANLFVAQFFAPEPPNIIPGKIESHTFRAAGSNLSLPANTNHTGPANCLIRPRSLAGRHASGTANQFHSAETLTAEIASIQHTGWSTILHLSCGTLALEALLPASPNLRRGDPFPVGPNPHELLFFTPSGERLT